MAPEEINKQFYVKFPATNDDDSKELSMQLRHEIGDFIRQSLIQLLDHVKEELVKEKEGVPTLARIAIDDCTAVIERIKSSIK